MALAGDDLETTMKTVNRLFCDNSPDASFATLFFGVFHTRTGRLSYANCGHEAALLIRRKGTIERLASSSQVIGMFRNWSCAIEECCLQPGDILAIATDGILEAANAGGEEFGERGLIEAVATNANGDPRVIIDAVLEEVRRFSCSGEQHDDITMVVARRA